jgi:hypothetical protein
MLHLISQLQRAERKWFLVFNGCIEKNGFTLVIVRTAACAADANCSCDDAAPATNVFVSSTRALAVFKIASRWFENISSSCSEFNVPAVANKIVVSFF